MRICFVLPGVARQPVGGYKMVYEYANRLVFEGCDVSILYLNQDTFKKYHLPLVVRRYLTNFLAQREPKWFELDSRIKKVSNLDKNYKQKLGNIDACFATSAEKTVSEVYNNLSAKEKFYFIQDYENWHVSDKEVTDTYKLGLNSIVISNWLKEIVDQYTDKPAVLIPNAIDQSIYKENIGILDRPNHTIALLYHEEPHKGLKNAFKVLARVKKIYPDLEVIMFGKFPKPQLPNWVTYYRNASQEQTVKIYNSVKVFLCSTIEEGYGLTGIEAMSCGACLVSTNYKGVREYAIDKHNALLSPVGDIEAQVNNVVKIFDNRVLQEEISQHGIQTANNFTWDKAMKKFNQVIGYSGQSNRG